MQKGVNERILQLLAQLVDRTNDIEKRAGRNALLDIDLIMADIRELYKEFESLRQTASIELIKETKTNVEPPTPLVSTTYNLSGALRANEPVQKAKSTEHSHIEAIQPASVPTVVEPVEGLTTEKQSLISKEASTVKTTIESSGLPNPAPAAKEHMQHPLYNEPLSPTNQKTTYPKEHAPVPSVQSPHKRNALQGMLAARLEDKSLSARLQMSPVANIKDAIGINEKFVFINELFGGNIQQYNETIQRLNNFGSLDEAFHYLSALGETLGWDEAHSGETIERLASVVMRRYLQQ
ncbi:MAG TPA: hypothetical protein DCM62_07790 [Bacteroidales bacterium]|nr:hypothetical protein [Bacteroidales bacterium]